MTFEIAMLGLCLLLMSSTLPLTYKANNIQKVWKCIVVVAYMIFVICMVVIIQTKYVI